MYINMQNTYYDYNNQTVSYIEVVSSNVSSDGTFKDLNDMFEKLSFNIKIESDKKRIFELYKDCIYFGEEESKKLLDYIKKLSIKEKENIFDYYD